MNNAAMARTQLHLPEPILSDAKARAVRNGTSLDQFLSRIIAERIGEMKALANIEARIARADMAAALAVLAMVPVRPSLAGDEAR